MGLLGSFKSIFPGGRRVDLSERFELLREGISGTMAEFYKARDRQTDQIVGLKVLDPEKLAAFESRFKGLTKPSEGEILSQLDHPRIVKLIEYGRATNGRQFLVMEFIDGPGMNSVVLGDHRALDGRRIPLLRQAGEALAAVHKAGFLHRDVCPRNYVLTPDLSSLKLIDFGLAVPLTAEFMQPGNRTGTPNYMAPELVKRQATDQRVDVFAFGCTAYELMTKQLPWERGTTGQAAMLHVQHAPRPIYEYRADLNATLGDAIMKCVERDAGKRCRSIDDFLKMIKDVKSETNK